MSLGPTLFIKLLSKTMDRGFVSMVFAISNHFTINIILLFIMVELFKTPRF